MGGLTPSDNNMDSMEKRAFLAIVLSLIILIGWQMLFLRKPLPPKQETPQITTKIEEKKEEKVSHGLSPDLISGFRGNDKGKEIPVETDLYSAIFSTRGGGLKSWKLKKYKDKIGKGALPMNLVNQTNPDFYPFFLHFSLPKYQYLTSVKYDIEEHNDTEIVLSYQDSKIKMKRTYRFVPNSYQVEHATYIWSKENFGGDVFLGTSEGLPQDPQKEIFKTAYLNNRNFLYHSLNKTHRKKLSDIKENEEIKTVMTWMGIDNQYFLFSMVNKSDVRPYLLLSSPLHGAWDIAFQYPFHQLPQKDFFEAKVVGYIGPKEVSRLKEVGSKLEDAVDFGMFSFICIPLLKVMNLFYKYVIHNYGIAILFLTLLVRVVFHPLTKKSYVSMRELQRIQPQMAKIKEKFKDNKEQMNKAIMELMKTNKVNPLGGCLPIVVQMPIFFALYALFYNAIELYQAPFFGWVQDLSAKDPYYIYPALMGASMFLQQKMTPATTMDPAQQKMMLFMPVIFSFFMIGLPSGLVIYILFSTLLQVASQYLVNREFIKKGL